MNTAALLAEGAEFKARQTKPHTGAGCKAKSYDSTIPDQYVEEIEPSKPKAGAVLIPVSEEIKITIQYFKEDDIFPVVYVHMIVYEGQWRVASDGHHGLKIFLNRRTAATLREHDGKVFAYGGTLMLKGSVRITGYAASGRAAQGEIV